MLRFTLNGLKRDRDASDSSLFFCHVSQVSLLIINSDCLENLQTNYPASCQNTG